MFLYSVNNNKVNFEIGKVNITGDRDLNQNIINQIKNLKTKKNNPIIYNLSINTTVKKIITSKDNGFEVSITFNA